MSLGIIFICQIHLISPEFPRYGMNSVYRTVSTIQECLAQERLKKTPKPIPVSTETELRAATLVTPPLPCPKREEGDVLAVPCTNLVQMGDYMWYCTVG